MICTTNLRWLERHLPQSPENIAAKGAGFRRKTLQALIAKDNQILALQRKIRCLTPPRIPGKVRKEASR